MKSDRIEALLERIAVALERLVEQPASPSYVTEALKSHPAVYENIPDTPALSSSPACPSILEPFLNSKSIRIKARPVEDPADRVIDSLSLFLGEHYNALSSLLGKIKRAMQAGTPIFESLRGRSQQDINSVCQFCTRLHEVAFLEQYRYFRSPTNLIKAKTTTLPKAQRFFGGQWLERFILQKVKVIHAQVASEVTGALGFEYLINPEITLPNGDDFELDILAAFGSSIYWIEAKSGDYQQHASKYSKFARRLGLDDEHSFMVLTDLPDDRCDALSSLFSMTVCNLRTFEDKLLSVARNDTAQESSTSDELLSVTEP